jgi:hypothetical protein
MLGCVCAKGRVTLCIRKVVVKFIGDIHGYALNACSWQITVSCDRLRTTHSEHSGRLFVRPVSARSETAADDATAYAALSIFDKT